MDDYPIHQTPLPVAHAGNGHPDHYDRYFFNGYRDDLYLGAAMAVYPNRGIIDAAVSLVHDGVQRSVYASGRMPLDRMQTRIGPISIDVEEPLRTLRITCDGAEHGLEADLRFTARTVALEEPRQAIHDGGRLMMDSTRLTQWGSWSGTIGRPGEQIDLDAVTTYGCKDRSWGIRPVGQPAPAAPSTRLPQIFFLWAPLNFPNRAVHMMCFERETGERWMQTSAVIPVLDGPESPTWGVDVIEHAAGFDYDIEWEPGLRRARRAELTLRPLAGDPETFTLEPRVQFRMRGIGYTHPEWGHGTWKGDLASGGDEFKVSELDTLDPSSIHIQQVVTVTTGTGDEGIGVLEQLVFGPHAPTGLADFLDGGR
jgi:hypothetical protein